MFFKCGEVSSIRSFYQN